MKINRCKRFYKDCSAWCCRYITVTGLGDFKNEDTKRWFKYRQIKHFGETFYIPCRCYNLNSDYTCKIYKDRPNDCKVFRCLYLGGVKKL